MEQVSADLAPEPPVIAEPPTAEELDKERTRSRLKKLGAPLIPLAVLAGKAKVFLLALVKIKAVTTLGSDLWRALANIGFFINLINLLPVLPLDGGRAMAVLGPMVWIVGILAAVAAAALFLGPIMLIFIVALGGPELYHRFKNRHSEKSREYHLVPLSTKLAVAAFYLSLAAILIVGITETYVSRTL